MKKLTLLLVVLLVFSCKQATKTSEDTMEVSPKKEQTKTASYPETLQKIFEAHGGIQTWKKYRTLSYKIPKADSEEIHTLDLRSRKDRIDASNFSMGYDGESVWLSDPMQVYTGDAVFYHNLMSYFYAMPFILGDEGIVYGEAEDLAFEGKNYPGVSISYNAGVGTSPKDEYFIHYDPQTNKMVWLGYTVTYRSGEVSDNVKWIRYDNWLDVEDVLLPKSITWHAYEGREIKEAKSTVNFEDISLSDEPKPDDFYALPEGGKVVTGK